MLQAGCLVESRVVYVCVSVRRDHGRRQRRSVEQNQDETAEHGQPVALETAPDDLALGASLDLAVALAGGLRRLYRLASLKARGRVAFLVYHLTISLVIAHPRVHQGISQVGHQVEEHYQRGADDQDPPRHVVIALVERVNEQKSKPWPGEDRLRNDRAVEDEPYLEGEEGHRWDHGVSQGMLEVDRALAEALGPRGAQVVCREHVEHGAALEAAQARDLYYGERCHRQGEMLQEVYQPPALRAAHPRDVEDARTGPRREVDTQDELEDQP